VADFQYNPETGWLNEDEFPDYPTAPEVRPMFQRLFDQIRDAFNAHLAEDATVEVKGHVQLGTTAGTAAEGNHKHNTAIVEVAASRDLALTDYNAFLNCTNAAAIIITIQPDATIDIPIGSEIALWQDGVGSVTIAEGAGVTVKSKDSNKKLDGQNSSAALIKKAANTWSLAGTLTT
jgi:hypothetical protein